MVVNQHGYRRNGLIDVGEANKLLTYLTEHNFASAKAVFASLKECFQLIGGMGDIRVPRTQENDTPNERLNKWKQYNYRAFEAAEGFVQWPNQHLWPLTDVGDVTGTTLNSSLDETPDRVLNRTRQVLNQTHEGTGISSVVETQEETMFTASTQFAQSNTQSARSIMPGEQFVSCSVNDSLSVRVGSARNNDGMQETANSNVRASMYGQSQGVNGNRVTGMNGMNGRQRVIDSTETSRDELDDFQPIRTSTPITDNVLASCRDKEMRKTLRELKEKFPNLRVCLPDDQVDGGLQAGGREQSKVAQAQMKDDGHEPEINNSHVEYEYNNNNNNNNRTANSSVGGKSYAEIALDRRELLDQRLEERQKQNARLQLFAHTYEKLDGMDPAKYGSWAETVKQRLILTEADNKTALSHIRVCLTGNALHMYEKANEYVKKSVEETWRFLDNRFGDLSCQKVRNSTFHSCNQAHNQGIRHYVMELESRCFLTRDMQGFESVMVDRLCHGLREHKHIKMAQNELLEDGDKPALALLVKKIEKDENMEKMSMQEGRQNVGRGTQKFRTGYSSNYGQNSRNQANRFSRPWCTFCQTHTHSTNNCRVNQNRNGGARGGYGQTNHSQVAQGQNSPQFKPNVPNANNFNSPPIQQRNNAPPDRKFSGNCFNCNQPGHTKANCPRQRNQNVISQAESNEGKQQGDDDCNGQVCMVKFSKNEAGKLSQRSECEKQTEVIMATMSMGKWKHKNKKANKKSKNSKKLKSGMSMKENTGKLFIQGIQLKSVRNLLDTGASGNMISPKFFEQVKEKNNVELKPNNKAKFKSFTGQKIEVLGSCKLTINMENEPIKTTVFYVCPMGDYDVLMGKPALDALDIKLRTKAGYVVEESDETEKNKTIIACLKEEIELQSDDEEAIVVVQQSQETVGNEIQMNGENIVIRVNLKEDKITCLPQVDGQKGVNVVVEHGENEIQFSPDIEDEQVGETVFDRYELPIVQMEPEVYLSEADELEKFMEKIKIHKSAEEDKAAEMKSMLYTKKKAFSTGYVAGKTQNVDDIGTTKFTHRIDTGDHPPIKEPIRRLPLNCRDEVKKMLEDLLNQGCIQPSESDWRSAIVLVRKKDGSFRLCIDYRKLNQITRQDAYPMPLIEDLLDRIQGWEFCSVLDIKSGYHHVKMDPKDAPKTAFYALEMLFEWKVMPFGLTTAPATFSRAMNQTLEKYIDNCCVCYLDDVLIFSKNYEQHLIDVGNVLDTLAEAGFKLNPNKCEFLCNSVEYLGHLVTTKGIRADPSKIKAITEFPLPETKIELWRFLGMAGYLRRFFSQLSRMLAPLFEVLTALEKHKSKVIWTPELLVIFEKVKEKMSSPPVLAYPKPGLGYRVTTDACADGLGAVMEQNQEALWVIIAFASRRTSKSERNLDATMLEAKAVLFAVEKFHAYLVNEEVTLVTDHKPLLGLFTKNNTCVKLQRWALLLQGYNLKMVYGPGKQNTMADCLSRAAIKDEKSTDRHLIGLITVGNEQDKEVLLKLHHDKQAHENGDKLYHKLRYWYDGKSWPNMRGDCKQYVKNCNVCKMRSNRYEKLPLEAQPPPEQPRQRWHLDFAEVRRSSVKPYFCLAVDAFSRYVIAMPAAHQTSEIAVKTVDQIIARFGVPKEITSDNGSHFIGKKFQEHLKLMGVKHHFTTPYYKNGNGLAERAIQSIQGVAAKYLEENQINLNNWHVHMTQILAKYNQAYHDSLGMSPFKVVHAVECSMSPDEYEEHPILEKFWDEVRKNIVQAQRVNANYAYKNVKTSTFATGDKVLVKDTQSMGQRARKIDLPNKKKAVITELARKGAYCEFEDGSTRRVPLEFLQHRSE